MKILLPVDGSSCSARAIDTVLRDFDPATTEVHVVHAIERAASVPPYLAFAEGPSAADDVLESYAGERQREEAKALTEVERLRSAGFEVTVDVHVGSTAGVIFESAAAWQPDRIVMGSHGRSGLPRLLLGSIASDVRRAAACTVDMISGATESTDETNQTGKS
jgi:nucleotide-binding universal stress UspA family protein